MKNVVLSTVEPRSTDTRFIHMIAKGATRIFKDECQGQQWYKERIDFYQNARPGELE